ncbi:MAG: phage tail protein [Schwartzia sp.]|nr:phage tail protein [Schwartzia sp. (in: firmicutes)]
MLEVNVGKSIEEAQRLLTNMPGAVNKASKTAIRTTIKGMKKESAQKVRERYTIKASKVTNTIRTSTGDGGLTARLTSKGRVNDLSYFIHKPKSVPKRRPPTGKYLYSQVVKGEGGTIAHAFLARMQSGHVGVFQRAGHGSSMSSLPIQKLSGPSTPQMLGSPNIKEFIEKRLRERFEKNLSHEVNAFLMGYRK